MKRNKIALISMLVFMTVFSLTAIIDIQSPFKNKREKATEVDEVVSTQSDTLAQKTQDVEIQSFSNNSNQSTISNEASIDLETEVNTSEPNSDAEVSDVTTAPVATAAPTPSPTPEVTEAPKQQYANIGISVAKDFVNIREKPSTDGEILGKLYRNSAAEIIKAKGDWYYVESGSVKGYIKQEFLKTGIPDDELVKKYGTLSIDVDVDGLNVRKEPSTDAKKVTVIYKDETYPVLDSKDEWLKIELADENTTGYVLKEFTEVVVAFKDAVSKEEEQKLLQLAAEERAKKETEVKYGDGFFYTNDDLKLLACLIHAEAGTQSYEGKLAVANIVLNRVKSSKYPDSIKAVIYQSGQFSVARSGSLQKQLNNYSDYDSNSEKLSLKAAKAALAGANNIGKRLYFHSYKAAVNKGYDSKSASVKIGGLLFW